MTIFSIADYRWKFAIKDQKSANLRTQTLPKEREERILNALLNSENPNCLQKYISASKNPAVAKLKLKRAEFKYTHFLVTVATETGYIELLTENALETCVYQCLKENNCEDFFLRSEKG